MAIRYQAILVDKITPSLQKIKTETESVKVSFNGLKTVLGALTAAFSARELIDYTSRWTDLNSRFKNVIGDARSADDALKQIAQTARSTYSSLEATAETFLRNSKTLQELGITTQEQINLSDALNNALAISGTKGAQAESVMNALSKAFARGKLSGEEFNTVIESGGRVAEALADGLGVTTLELRQMAAAGRLETLTVIEALSSQMEKLRQESADMPVTARDGFTLLNNAVFEFIGRLDTAIGSSTTFGESLEAMADAITSLAQNAEKMAELAIVVTEVAKAIGMLLAVVGGILSLAPIGRVFLAGWAGAKTVAVGVGALVSTLKSLPAALRAPLTRNNLFNELKVFPTLGKKIETVFVAMGGKLEGLWKSLGITATALGAVGLGINAYGNIQDKFAEQQKKANSTLQDSHVQLYKQVDAARQARAAYEEIKRVELAKEFAEINRQLELSTRNYRENVESQIDSIRSQTQLIGASEEQKRLTQELRVAESAYYRESTRLADELAKAKTDAAEKDGKEKEIAELKIKTLVTQQEELNKSYARNALVIRDLVSEEQRRLSVQKQIQEQFKIDDNIAAYKEQNNIAMQNIALETAKLRLSDSQRSTVDALMNIEQQRLNTIKPLQERILELKRSTNESDKELIPILEQGIANINTQYGQQINLLNELLSKKEEEIRLNNLLDFTRKQSLDTEAQLRKIQDETAKLTMTEIEKKYYDIAAAARESMRAAIEAEEARRGETLSSAEIQEYYKVARENAERLIESTERHNKASREWSTGWKKAYKDYISEATNAAKTAESVFTKATKGMEDAIVGFAKTGKFEWKSFVSSMLEELLRSQVRKVFAGLMGDLTGINQQATQNMQGGAFGSLSQQGNQNLLGNIGNLGSAPQSSTATPGFGGSSFGGIFDTIKDAGSWINKNIFGGFFANGGNLAAGKFGIVGERGPELISGPATITPMQAQSVTYNINAVDAMSFKQMIAADPSFIHGVAMMGSRTVPARR